MSYFKFRYGTSSLTFSDALAIRYPIQEGLEFYSFPLENPEYIVIEREYPSTRLSLESVNVKNPAPVWNLWESTLERGVNDFTVIDEDLRLLFDVSWPQWEKRWSKRAGGVHDIKYNLDSPVDWTPPTFGFYPSTTNSLVNHNLSGDDLTVDEGTLVDYATDNTILRQTGYALRIENQTPTPIGASASGLSWKAPGTYNGITMFCQAYMSDLDDGEGGIDLMSLTESGTDSSVRLRMDPYAGNTDLILGSYVQRDGQIETYIDSDNGPAYNLDVDTWYDVCLTYDGADDTLYQYWWPSAVGSVWQKSDMYMDGETDLLNSLVSDTLTYYPTDTTWTDLALLKCTSTDPLTSPAEYGYIQNAMVMQGFVSPLEFNKLRRLCYMWNTKTSGSWPK